MRLPSALLVALALAACGGKSDGDKISRPFFWSAEKDGKTTYFLGTYHVGVDPKRLPDLVHAKLDAAGTFVSETNTHDPAVLSFGQRKHGGTLRDDLGPVYWAKLEKLLDGNTLSSLNRMAPVMTLLTLQFKDLPPQRMDEELRQRARDAKKQLAFLEPAEKQVRILEKWFEVRMLKGYLDDPDPTPANEMAAIYASGDEARLLAFFHADMRKMTTAGFSEAELVQATEDMLYERNRAWIEPLEAHHARGDAFVAVGAAHLVGPNSVLDLLAKRGYTITRLAP